MSKLKPQNLQFKIYILQFTIVLFVSNFAFSQAVGISGEYFVPDASALLELKDTTKGLLMTRLTTTQRDNISNPAEAVSSLWFAIQSYAPTQSSPPWR